MRKWILAIVAVVMTACATPQKAEPEVLSPVDQKIIEQSYDQSFMVRINFVLFKDEVDKYPAIAKSFQEALTEWTNNLPIEAAVFIEERQTLPFILLWAQNAGVSSQPGIVRVHLTDIQAAPYHVAENVLGFWLLEKNDLYIDTDSSSLDSDLCYLVCLHELGHVFGLPHFVEPRSPDAITGTIVVIPPVEANTLVMYPQCNPANRRAKLSKLEISIALHYLLDLQQLVRNDCLHLTSQ